MQEKQAQSAHNKILKTFNKSKGNFKLHIRYSAATVDSIS